MAKSETTTPIDRDLCVIMSHCFCEREREGVNIGDLDSFDDFMERSCRYWCYSISRNELMHTSRHSGGRNECRGRGVS